MSEACQKLHALVHRLPRLRFPFDWEAIPEDGIYLLFEEGEPGHGGARIVRVGSHRGAGNLPARLNEHFLKENKDRSIFRKNIGRALLHRDNDPFLAQWAFDLTSRADRMKYEGAVDRARLAKVEQEVTQYIRSRLSFVVIAVAGTNDERLLLERKLIGTVASCGECRASSSWLGFCSPKKRIREGKLWLEQGLRQPPLTAQQIDSIWLPSVSCRAEVEPPPAPEIATP
jgi:hypothetical protein